ncbi:YddF family protein [Bacillus paralicheniformis]|uniref:YddF family protein n=1 Tax=Bacillus paralicheniformis TaxID=1648923 RepID=UPI002DBB9D2C|nr:YddF family protein [Bacillus paralicheniformis]MEC1053551.1 YddF family protein [Bacillus paralicheniformis]MEC1088541.1 YddF family protein [Bacillus paralicheniformis]MEC1104891.1 YddF family protein [Bacillus paralicheniformis]MEC1112140.1 YddF family protein [Bacillus paralicheniformis]MEC1141164.1 YddF family protein [Bacillus paralicheniformis]
MEIAFLNSMVMTCPGFYKAEKITLEDVRRYLDYCNGSYKSFIGHESTALFLQELLGIKIKQNRKCFKQRRYQKAICFSLKGRYPENKVLTKEDLKKADYQFYLITRLD